MTAEQFAVHELVNACRRLETLLRGKYTPMQIDERRCQAVMHMAVVLEEFGLVNSAENLRKTKDQFCREGDME